MTLPQRAQITSAAVHGYAHLAILILVNGNSDQNVNVGEFNAHKNKHFYISW